MNSTGLARTIAAALALACAPLALSAAQPGRQKQVLPPEMLGSWGQEAEDCTDPDSEARLHVTTQGLEFSGAKFQITRIRQSKTGSWILDGLGNNQGEKKKRRGSAELTMKDKDYMIVRIGHDEPAAYRRCTPEKLQG